MPCPSDPYGFPRAEQNVQLSSFFVWWVRGGECRMGGVSKNDTYDTMLSIY